MRLRKLEALCDRAVEIWPVDINTLKVFYIAEFREISRIQLDLVVDEADYPIYKSVEQLVSEINAAAREIELFLKSVEEWDSWCKEWERNDS